MSTKKSLKLLMSLIVVALAVFLASDALAVVIRPPVAPPKSLKEDLGDKIFNDINLSSPVGIACQSCHDAFVFWADPRNTATSAGSLGTSGTRNAPQLSYVAFTPARSLVTGKGYIGGLFWDGREVTLQSQANKPFLNPIEMNMTPATLITAIAAQPYAAQFRHVYGVGSLDTTTPTLLARSFNFVADALEAYMSQAEFHNFKSKFDYFINGFVALTPAESRGMTLFNGKAGCAACHPSTPSADSGQILFTDYSYHNLGLPTNPLAAPLTPDLGLGAAINRPAQNGKFKTPTLRNIAFTGPYGHNGFYTTIGSMLNFLNARGTTVPEVAANIVNPNNTLGQIGNLGLTTAEKADLRAFLATLSDGFVFIPPNPLQSKQQQ